MYYKETQSHTSLQCLNACLYRVKAVGGDDQSSLWSMSGLFTFSSHTHHHQHFSAVWFFLHPIFSPVNRNLVAALI